MAHKSEHVSTVGGFSVLNNGTKTTVIAQDGTINVTDISMEDATMTGNTSIGDAAADVLTITGKVIANKTATTIDAQNGTPDIAVLLGGVILHNSKTGAGTLTLPTGTEISAGIAGVATGNTFDVLYNNYGNQTVTITGATGSTIKGTAAVSTTKNAMMRFVCTGANAWSVFTVVSA